MAYNAEKTLPKTIKSVLNQTYRNLVYYIVDNGSKDRTGEIIKEAAAKDSRIIPLANKENHVWKEGNTMWEIIAREDKRDVFCWLDADDEYKPKFIEKMFQFMRINGLDIAACGNDFVDAASGKVLDVRKLSSNLILEGRGFSDYFPYYHQFIRATWAKLYTLEVLSKYSGYRASGDYCYWGYGIDTLVGLENFRNADRVGILAESLHKYYMSKKSFSYQLDPIRGKSSRVLHEKAQNFLMDKCGEITARNREFLLSVYQNDFKDSLNVILTAKTSLSQKLSLLYEMFDCQSTRELISYPRFIELKDSNAVFQTQRKTLFATLIDWMLSLDEVPDEQVEHFCEMGTLFSAAADNQDGWIFFQKLQLQYLEGQGRIGEAKLQHN